MAPSSLRLRCVFKKCTSVKSHWWHRDQNKRVCHHSCSCLMASLSLETRWIGEAAQEINLLNLNGVQTGKNQIEKWEGCKYPWIYWPNRNMNQSSALRKLNCIHKKEAGKFGGFFSGLSPYSLFKGSEEMPLGLATDLNLEAVHNLTATPQRAISYHTLSLCFTSLVQRHRSTLFLKVRVEWGRKQKKETWTGMVH